MIRLFYNKVGENMRKVNEIITFLRSKGTWVNWDKTRDVVLYGDTDRSITKIGTCWVLTNHALQQAIAADIHFVISHENCFYFESTQQYRLLLESRNRKQALLKAHDITVYRSHDVWDYVSEFGNIDTFTKLIGLEFNSRQANDKYAFASFTPTSLTQIAKRITGALQGTGQAYCEILGNSDKEVTSLAVGIGAACNIFEMLSIKAVDCLMVSDDGACNWIEYQYCVDNDIPLIIVHHSTNEIPGMRQLTRYLKNNFSDLEVLSLDEGIKFSIIK